MNNLVRMDTLVTEYLDCWCWVLEMFGLPGDRYTVSFKHRQQDYIFKSEEDALLMALRWNGKILNTENLT